MDAGDSAQAVVECLQQAVGVLHREGAPLLIGADPTNPGVRTGFSVHDELEHFRRAGLSTLDVLRCATVNAARFLGQEGEWGTVTEGMRSDLVLTDADPLADLSTLRRPRAVLCNGYLLARDALDRLLDHRARALAEPTAPHGDGRSDGKVIVRQGEVVVGRGTFVHRPVTAGRTEIVERHSLTQMGLSIVRSSTIVLDREQTVVSARVIDETSIGQSTFEIERVGPGYRLTRRDLDGWEESAAVESSPLHPSNRLSPAAFMVALAALTASTARRVVDLPFAGPLAEVIAPTERSASTDGGSRLVVHRHGERSEVAVSRPAKRTMIIDEDRFHGRFRSAVVSNSRPRV